MPNYRRYRVEGGTYFFTVKTERNIPLFSDPKRIQQLGNLFREMQTKWPCEITALVLLPDHMHAIWTLPSGDANYPARWGWIKKEFTQLHLATRGPEVNTSRSRKKNRRRGVWQRRYWEHTIEDEDDFEAHFDYVHWNPVKHGYVRCPREWPHSSFHRWVKHGVYEPNWGCGGQMPPSIVGLTETGE